MYHRLFFMGPVCQLTHLWSSLTIGDANNHHSPGGHIWLYILSMCIIYTGDTESGALSGSLIVVLSSSFMCHSRTVRWLHHLRGHASHERSIHSLQCWRVRDKSPEVYPARTKDWTWGRRMTGAHATTCTIATLLWFKLSFTHSYFCHTCPCWLALETVAGQSPGVQLVMEGLVQFLNPLHNLALLLLSPLQNPPHHCRLPLWGLRYQLPVCHVIQLCCKVWSALAGCIHYLRRARLIQCHCPHVRLPAWMCLCLHQTASGCSFRPDCCPLQSLKKGKSLGGSGQYLENHRSSPPCLMLSAG